MADVQFTDPYATTQRYQQSTKKTSKMQSAITGVLVKTHIAKSEKMAQLILFATALFVIGISGWLLLQYGDTAGAPNLPETSENAGVGIRDMNNLSPNFNEF